MIRFIFYFFSTIAYIKILACSCCDKTNYKDNEFCFLPGNLDVAYVKTFMNNTKQIIEKIEENANINLPKTKELVYGRKCLKNKPEEVAIKNFIAFCEILFLLSRSYHLIKFLKEKITDPDKKREFENKRLEYINFLDDIISKKLAKKIQKKENTTNVNDLVKIVSKKCSECFSKILYCYVYEIEEDKVNSYNKGSEDYLDCLVSYISETDKLKLEQ